MRGRDEIDRQFKLSRLLNRKIARTGLTKRSGGLAHLMRVKSCADTDLKAALARREGVE
jgi:hypothetical protein